MATTSTPMPPGQLKQIPVVRIRPNPFQPRTEFDPAEITGLANSMAEHGLLQPISVRPAPGDPGAYELIAGERRTRAADELKWTTISAVVRDLSDRQMAALGLIENLQRANLTPEEEAAAYKRLIDELGYTYRQIEAETGIPKSTITDRLHMLAIAPVWRDLVAKGTLQLSHVPHIHRYAKIPEGYQAELAKRVLDDYGVKRDLEAGGSPGVADFEHVLEREAERFMHPLFRSEYGRGCSFNPAQYKGPVIVRRRRWGGGTQKWAADPDIFRPLVNRAKAEKAKRAKAQREKDGEEGRSTGEVSHRSRPMMKLPEGAKVDKNHGYLGTGEFGYTRAMKGKTPVYIREASGYSSAKKGWWFGASEEKAFDPAVFMREVDGEQLIYYQGQYAGAILATTDNAALGRARTAFLEVWDRQRDALLAEKADILRKKWSGRYEVSGHGAVLLIQVFAALEATAIDLWYVAQLLERIRPGTLRELPAMTTKKDGSIDLVPFTKWARYRSESEAAPLASAWACAIENELSTLRTAVEAAYSARIDELRVVPVDWTPGAPKVTADAQQEIKAAVEKGIAEGEAVAATCVVCGCDDEHACEGGCSWLVVSTDRKGVSMGVCSSCASGPADGMRILDDYRREAAGRSAPADSGTAPHPEGNKWERRKKRGSAKHVEPAPAEASA